MESPRPQLVILAEKPEAFCILFGISLLERLLRVVQRLGFRDAIVLSSAPEAIAAHLAKPSWARGDVALAFRQLNGPALQVNDLMTGAQRILLVPAGFYYDARLLKTLTDQTTTTLLIDSSPPPDCELLWRNAAPAAPGAIALHGPALLDRDWLSRQDQTSILADQLSADVATGRIETCDGAKQPTYVMSLRKHVRPVFFPAPSSDLLRVAERFPRDAAQNGILDFPGWLDSPIEDWLVARLCRTSITPNQITGVTMLIGLMVTALFATGHLWWGVALAYVVGVLDGVDGKLARTKVETTAVGDWEHVTDYFIELSWWSALAFHFQTQRLACSYLLLILLVGSDLIDRLAKRVVKKKVGRNLDDVSNFDRFVRCIGGRRNINIWILIAALALGDARSGFILFCWWGAATAAAHVVRAFQIRFSGERTRLAR